MDPASIQTQLQAALPAGLRPHLHTLAAILGGVIAGSLHPSDAERRLTDDLGLAPTLRSLSGKELAGGASLIHFGANSQAGDISIGDVAGGNLIKISVNFPFEELLAIGRQTGVFGRAQARLLAAPGSPDEATPLRAAEQLAIVLAEIRKIYTALDGELSAYLGLFFDPAAPPAALHAERNKLIDLQSGRSALRIGEARGSCAKIMRMYGLHLVPWFQAAALPDQQREEIAGLFRRLDEYDGAMVQILDRITAWLVREAEQTLELVDQGLLDEANARVRLARKSVLPSQRELFATAGAMLELEVAFGDVAGVL
jgi:hypothetical protein